MHCGIASTLLNSFLFYIETIKMKPSDVKKYYRTGYNFRKETGMSDSTLYNWLRWGQIPFDSQKKIEELTDNKLIAVWKDKD